MLDGIGNVFGASSMNALTKSNSCCLAMPRPLAVSLLAQEDGPPLRQEPVTAADLSDAIAEAWRDQCLRCGICDQSLTDVPMELVPLFPQGKRNGRCNGFALDVQLPDGQSRRQSFTISSLRPVADRMADSLLATGVLGTDQR